MNNSTATVNEESFIKRSDGDKNISKEYRILLEKKIGRLFSEALKVSLTRPAFGLFLLRFIRKQNLLANKRFVGDEPGKSIPPFMIISITKQCNLKCSGCYSRVNHESLGREMSTEKLVSLITQAQALGTSIALLAGGEPFSRKDILGITEKFPAMLFPVFTNGMLIDDEIILRLRRQKNVIPILSLEGDSLQTDRRRGKHVFSTVSKTLEKLKKNKIFCGISFTATAENLDTITDEDYIKEKAVLGAKVFFYNEYVPFESGTENLCLHKEQRIILEDRLKTLRRKNPALFISFPGDEEEFDGCLSAGRGFFHVNPSGDVEPCPFAPYSVSSLEDVSLKEALDHPFLQTIRANHNNLHEEHGGCALWNNKKWIEKLQVKHTVEV
ncbi:MAG: radical SAM protein [Spirochaetaceae bacterium]|nr:radical SAM protein [Spirochaetaceae bacterium]